jgi:hypothetical protein
MSDRFEIHVGDPAIVSVASAICVHRYLSIEWSVIVLAGMCLIWLLMLTGIAWPQGKDLVIKL